MEHIIFEEKLLEKLLKGDDPILEELRKQYKHSTISREFTGAGFYTNFRVTNCKPIANEKSFQIGDVNAIIDGDDSKIGFILFIKDGFLNFLEGYAITLDEWPNEYDNIILSYNNNDVRNIEGFINKARNCFSDYNSFSNFVNDSEFFVTQNNNLFSEEERIEYEKIWLELEIINSLMLEKLETNSTEKCKKIWEYDFIEDAEKIVNKIISLVESVKSSRVK